MTIKIGNAIKLCRQQKRLGQAELAAKSSISAAYLSLVEQNKRDPPLSTIERIATALDVPITILAFLAADADSLPGFSQELTDKISSVALSLIRKPANE